MFTLTPIDDDVALRSKRLEATVALVTGGGRGIGRLLARSLADAGAAVGVIARSGAELSHTVDLIEASGGTAVSAVADVVDADDLRRAVDTIQRRLGPIDLLVNNAGIVGPIGPLWKVDADEWWTAMDVNVRGLVLASQLVLPEMIARRRGRIINLTSQAGVHRWPLVSAYSVSKAAVVKLTENLAHETARHAVSVFSVHPGLLAVGMYDTIAAHVPTTPYEEHIRDWTMNAVSEGRGADPADAIELILRLAAGDGDSLTGRHISVHDDLDHLVARRDEINARDLYVLSPSRLTDPDLHS